MPVPTKDTSSRVLLSCNIKARFINCEQGICNEEAKILLILP